MMASRINVSTPMMTTNEEDKGKDMDANYALQVALRHMKERCQKQQARIQLLEEENRKLIQQKSDLYEEIGKLQENNIKLRERNLSLNHEIHSKHQECCSIRESLTSTTQEKAKLGLQIPKLEAQIESLQKILRTKDQTVTPQLKSSVNVFQAPFSSHDIGTQTKAVDGHMKALISAMKSLLNRDFATKWNGLHPAMVPFEKMVQLEEEEAKSLCENQCRALKESLLSQQEIFSNLLEVVRPWRSLVFAETRSAASEEEEADLERLRSWGATPTNSLSQRERDQASSLELASHAVLVPSHPASSIVVERGVGTSPPPEAYHTCPICEDTFSQEISHEEFESHVVQHFEVDEDSFLAQFEIISGSA